MRFSQYDIFKTCLLKFNKTTNTDFRKAFERVVYVILLKINLIYKIGVYLHNITWL